MDLCIFYGCNTTRTAESESELENGGQIVIVRGIVFMGLALTGRVTLLNMYGNVRIYMS